MPYSNNSYSVGWICALGAEHVAAVSFLDAEHDRPKTVAEGDQNDYTLGQIGQHNIVITVLPQGEYGTNIAAHVATNMVRSFPHIRIGLMVGIGGGAPSSQNDIRLGDIVVSSSDDSSSGVFQFDFGKTIQNRSFQHTAFLNKPPITLRTAVSSLASLYERKGHNIESSIEEVLRSTPRLRKKYSRPDEQGDILYRSHIVHPEALLGHCKETCGTSPDVVVTRRPRIDRDNYIAIHYGLIASSNQLIKDANVRDYLSEERQVLCFEMEAAGLMNHFPCLVIRGVCDYSDSHKNKLWQGYAAMTAAAYAKDLLLHIHPISLSSEQKLCKTLIREVQLVRQEVGKINQAREEQKYERICDWIIAGNHYKHLSDLESLVGHGTGRWFLNHEKYKRWKIGNNRMLLCPGAAGAGKTILSAIIIRNLLEDFPISKSSGVVYYFCSFQSQSRVATAHVLSSFLEQIGRWLRPFPAALEDLYDRLYDRSQPHTQRPTQADLLKTFTSISKEFSTLYVVIDALDEFSDDPSSQNQLGNVIGKMKSDCESVKILATSRPDAFLYTGIKLTSTPFEELEIKASRQDLESYLRPRLADIPCMTGDEDGIEQAISDIVMAANGMFLFAHLSYENLRASMNRKSIEQKLLRLMSNPDALEGAYSATLARIQAKSKEERHVAERTIHWVYNAKRPLSVSELQVALAIDEEDTDFDERKLIPQKQILSTCAGLLNCQPYTKFVVFCHQTVPEYLKRVARSWIDRLDARLSNTCTKCLQFSSHPSEGRQVLAFFNYSANFGGRHAFEVQEQSLYIAFGSALKAGWVLRAIVNFAFGPRSGYRTYHTPSEMAIHILAYFGLYKETLDLLNQLPVDSATFMLKGMCGRNNHTPLYFATREDQHKTIQALLIHGAYVNARNGKDGWTALDVAIQRRQYKTVEILLQWGAELSAVNEPSFRNILASMSTCIADGQQETQQDTSEVLQFKFISDTYASRFSLESRKLERKEFFRLYGTLKDRISDNPAYRNYLRSPRFDVEDRNTNQFLEYEWLESLTGETFYEDYEDYGDLPYYEHDEDWDGDWELGEMGIHENGIDALVTASSNGLVHEVRNLLNLDVGADAGIDYALYIAATEGRDMVVEMLIQYGANLDEFFDGSNHLHAAARYGHQLVVETLIYHGIDLEARTGENETALAIAVQNGDEDILQVLLEAGADPNPADSHETSALQLASWEGNMSMVQLLLQNGADVDADGGGLGSALYEAVSNGDWEIVRILLEHNAIVGNGLRWDGIRPVIACAPAD